GCARVLKKAPLKSGAFIIKGVGECYENKFFSIPITPDFLSFFLLPSFPPLSFSYLGWGSPVSLFFFFRLRPLFVLFRFFFVLFLHLWSSSFTFLGSVSSLGPVAKSPSNLLISLQSCLDTKDTRAPESEDSTKYARYRYSSQSLGTS